MINIIRIYRNNNIHITMDFIIISVLIMGIMVCIIWIIIILYYMIYGVFYIL